jgi:hypothetical protein
VEDTELIDLLNRKVTQAIWDTEHPESPNSFHLVCPTLSQDGCAVIFY